MGQYFILCNKTRKEYVDLGKYLSNLGDFQYKSWRGYSYGKWLFEWQNDDLIIQNDNSGISESDWKEVDSFSVSDYRLSPVSKRFIVGWFKYDGESYLSTWVGDTEDFIMDISPEEYNGKLWDHSPDCKYYRFTNELSFEEKLAIAKKVSGTLVIAFKD
jgi:hypothetical protein